MTKRIETSVFESHFQGVVLTPGDEGYDERRTVWNAMVDRRPAVIARCVHTDDVVAALHFGRTNQLELGIRCGGHSILGHAVPEGGLMIDLSLMNQVQVDPHSCRARVQGGALDREAQHYGLVTTVGNVGVSASKPENCTLRFGCADPHKAAKPSSRTRSRPTRG